MSESVSGEKYISLETFRRDGRGVRTPVWFVVNDGKIYVITKESTGKVKRLANSPRVNFAACSFGGEIRGEWISGRAAPVTGMEAENAVKSRRRKYGFRAVLAGLATSRRGKSVVYLITPG